MLKWLTNLLIKGTVKADAHITTGGASSDFVKGDGTLDATVYSTQDDIDDSIDAVKIGGRNYLINSNFITVDGWGATNTVIELGSISSPIGHNAPKIHKNGASANDRIRTLVKFTSKVYTLSVLIKNIDIQGYSTLAVRFTNGLQRIAIHWDGAVIDQVTVNVGSPYNIGYESLNDGWYRVWCTFNVLESDYNISTSVELDLDREYGGQASELYATGFQLEIGNKATAWSPAPEDQVTDWNETNANSFAFLKNKPTKLSDFTNDGFATESWTNSNYAKQYINKGWIAGIEDNEVGFNSTATEAPTSGTHFGFFTTLEGNTNFGGAFAMRNDRAFFQTREQQVLQGWREFWHSGNLLQSSIDNWNEAYNWGDHSQEGYATESWVNNQGYLTSVGWTDLTGNQSAINLSDFNDDLSYDNYGSWNLKTNGVQRTTIQSGGTLDLIAGNNTTLQYGAGGKVTINSSFNDTTYTAGTGLDLTGAEFSFDTAWGDGRYLQSFTETDPTVPSHVKAITTNNISNWNGKENAFSKNTAFNKNFGTTAGTVAEGNHTHSNLSTGTGLTGSTYNGGTARTFAFDTAWGDDRYLSLDASVVNTINNNIGTDADLLYNTFTYLNASVLNTPNEANGYYVLGGGKLANSTDHKAQLFLGTNDDAMYYRSTINGTYGQYYHMASREWANSQFLTEETDPIFTASPAHGITNTDITNWDAKGVQLTADQPNANIHLKDSAGNIISTLNVGFLNNEGTTISFNSTTDEIELRNDDGDLLSSFPAGALMTGVGYGLNLTGASLELTDSANNVIDSVTLTIANVQGLQAALNAKADKTITITGTGDITGGGNLSANRTLDLTAATKTKINHGETAYGWGDFRDFGLDSSVIVSDLDNQTFGSIGFTSSATTNLAGLPYGGVINLGGTTGSNDSSFQIYGAYQNTSGIRYRRLRNGVLDNWVQVIDSNNLDSQATSLGFIKSGALPTVNDGQLTLSTGTGLTGSDTFSANQSANTTFTVGLSIATQNSLSLADTALQPVDLNGYATETWVTSQNYLTQVNWGDITGSLTNQTDLQTALNGKVDKVTGKGLSTNDYTTAEKNKLAGIEAGAEVNVQSDWDATSGDALILNKPTSFPPSSHTHPISQVTGLQTALDNKVDKITGKGLSTNDYTTAEKNKLSGIEAGAEVNVKTDWNATTGDAELLNKPTSFPPSAHTHVISNVTGLQTALDDKALKTTEITAGIGLAGGGDLSSDRTIGLSTSTQTKLINGDTAYNWGDHSQEGYLTSVDISNKADKSTTISAGSGMTGGGTLAGNRIITMGTPSDVTLSTTNSVTSNSHTHEFNPGGTEYQYIDGEGNLQDFPKYNLGVTRAGYLPAHNPLTTTISTALNSIIRSPYKTFSVSDMQPTSIYRGHTMGIITSTRRSHNFRLYVGTVYKTLIINKPEIGTTPVNFNFKLEYDIEFNAMEVTIGLQLTTYENNGTVIGSTAIYPNNTLALNTGTPQVLDILASSIDGGTITTYKSELLKIR